MTYEARTMDLAGRLIDLEREGWEALAAGNGGAYYRERLTTNAVMAFPFGILSREAALEAMGAGQPWERFEIRDPRVVELGPDSGVVVYSVIARRRGDEPYVAVASSTFVRGHEGWKLAFHQQSPAS